MRISQGSYYIFAALALRTLVTAGLLSRLRLGNGDLLERQSGDDAVNSLGTAAGVGDQPAQTQNTTSTEGATGGTGNGTTANSPGFISVSYLSG